MPNNTNCKNIFPIRYSDIPKCVADMKTIMQILLQLEMKYFTLFLIVTPFIFSQNRKSEFNTCWFIDMYDLHTFYAYQNLCVDLTHQWVLLKI